MYDKPVKDMTRQELESERDLLKSVIANGTTTIEVSDAAEMRLGAIEQRLADLEPSTTS